MHGRRQALRRTLHSLEAEEMIGLWEKFVMWVRGYHRIAPRHTPKIQRKQKITAWTSDGKGVVTLHGSAKPDQLVTWKEGDDDA